MTKQTYAAYPWSDDVVASFKVFTDELKRPENQRIALADEYEPPKQPIGEREFFNSMTWETTEAAFRIRWCLDMHPKECWQRMIAEALEMYVAAVIEEFGYKIQSDEY